jgi:hypothetical protein
VGEEDTNLVEYTKYKTFNSLLDNFAFKPEEYLATGWEKTSL